MAKIRQEINIIDRTSTSTGVMGGRVRLDTTQYSGTVTYYFEIVAKVTGATMTTVLEDTSGTDIVSIDTSAVVFTRSRSSFTPTSGINDYQVNITSTGVLGELKSARIIIIQDTGTDPLTSTETQIEIGNEETGKTNTTDAALTNPKYWYYDSDVWDGTLTCYAEVTYLGSSNMATYTIKLQEDNGSFGGWADKVTIVSAGTATTATRVRSASFTPTTGRNYRIVTVSSSSMVTHDVYNAKIIVQQSDLVTVDSYSESNYAASVWPLDNTNAAVGQSFTGIAGVLNRVEFYLYKSASPTGNATAKIYAHSGTFGTSSIPTGSALATSDNLDVSTLTTSVALVPFVFSGANRITLSAGTKYIVVIDYRSGSATNKVSVGTDTTSPSHGGNASSSTFGDVWTARSDDLVFYVYTDDTGITKLEPQYLLANTAVGATTGLADFDTYYDPAEWDGVTNVYYHEANNVSGGTSDAKLQSDPNGTPADVTDSTITNIIERERSAAMTMPGTAQTIDVNQTGT